MGMARRASIRGTRPYRRGRPKLRRRRSNRPALVDLLGVDCVGMAERRPVVSGAVHRALWSLRPPCQAAFADDVVHQQVVHGRDRGMGFCHH